LSKKKKLSFVFLKTLESSGIKGLEGVQLSENINLYSVKKIHNNELEMSKES